jgi:hypothetical protein
MTNRWAFCECLSGPRPLKAAVADLKKKQRAGGAVKG